MEAFEVHITADESIHEAAKQFCYKTIRVDLLRPDRSVLRTEHMTSTVIRMSNFNECRFHVQQVLRHLLSMDVKVVRAKIESPWYEHYAKQSLYVESHFESDEFKLATSKNQRKEVFLATDREYGRPFFPDFREQHADHEVELCLYDTNADEDADWFKLYRRD